MILNLGQILKMHARACIIVSFESIDAHFKTQ